MRCADCGVGMGAGEKADEEFVSHSGVDWMEAWEDGSTDQSHGWHWHWDYHY